MEYALLVVQQPAAGLSMQLGQDVARFLRFEPERYPDATSDERKIVFLHRVPGVLRVVPARADPIFVQAEQAQNRFAGAALVSPRHLFSFPTKMAELLGIRTRPSPENPEKLSTDDPFLWFVPVGEYFEFKSAQRTKRGWQGPSPGGLPHLYVARGVFPLRSELDLLTRAERELAPPLHGRRG